MKRAQRTELMLGALLAVMLIGLALLIRRDHVAPRDGVSVLAQLTAGAFGTGVTYTATNVLVAVVLALAANTSFGGLPVLMSLLARDNRLPHLFGLRAERPVYRYGVVALALLSAVLLIAVNADTNTLIPLFAIRVFIGFTVSQTGLVRHWRSQRPPRWLPRALINATGAVLTALAAGVFLVSKFTAGAWVIVIAVPALMLLFIRIQRYYTVVGHELGLELIPARPAQLPSSSWCRSAASARSPNARSVRHSPSETPSWQSASTTTRPRPPHCRPTGPAGTPESQSRCSTAPTDPLFNPSSPTCVPPRRQAARLPC